MKVLLGSVIGIIAACNCIAADAPAGSSGAFVLSSAAFADNGPLPKRFAGNATSSPNCVGENISPPLSWSDPPQGTRSYALLLQDPEGRNGLGVAHWVAYGIPASLSGFVEGEGSKPSAQYVGGKNSRKVQTYSGPCPPPGGWHHYTFTLIATDLDPKALQPGMTRDELLVALSGHALGGAGLIGRFRHE